MSDDEFTDDGVDTIAAHLRLSPVGEVTLGTPPRERVYKPRTIAGHEDLAWLRYCRERREHVIFYGPPGTGKSILTDAAFHTGLETLVCSVDTTEADFMGTFVEDPESHTFLWAPGPLQRAVQAGVPLYVDEIFLANARVLAATLYPLMDGRDVLRIPANPTLPPIPVQDGFFVVGSGNPHVRGADFSEALRSRFDHHVAVNTDWKLARELNVPAKLVAVAKTLDQSRRDGLLTWSPQLREAIQYRNAKDAFGEQFAVQDLIGKFPEEDREQARDIILARFGISTPLALGDRYE